MIGIVVDILVQIPTDASSDMVAYNLSAVANTSGEGDAVV